MGPAVKEDGLRRRLLGGGVGGFVGWGGHVESGERSVVIESSTAGFGRARER